LLEEEGGRVDCHQLLQGKSLHVLASSL